MFNWITLAIAAVLLTAVGVFGFVKGVDRGASAAANEHEEAITALHSSYKERLNSRDTEWQVQVDNLMARLQEEREQRQRDLERERELSRELDETRRLYEDLRDEIPTAEIGSCNLTPEFDRMLHRALAAD